MSKAKLDTFIPLDLGWIARESQDWEPADAGPLFWVILYMWPKAGRVPNEVRKLAKIARVSVKEWTKIRDRVGAFFREEGPDLVQDHLVTLYASKAKTFISNHDKTSNAANARWGRERAKKALAAASRDASSIAPSNASSIASRYASGVLRASSCINPDLDLEREEESNARPVPISPDDPEVLAAIRAFPRSRTLPDGVTTEVIIGESAAHLAAEFLTLNPGYPLLPAVRYSAAQGKRIRNFDNWIADPPARTVVIAWWESYLIEKAEKERVKNGQPKPDAAEIRQLVRAVNDHSKAQRRLAHA